MTPGHAVAVTTGRDLLPRLVGNAPNLLPRLARVAPAFLARGLRRPVFLLGCGRSGKTVMAELLSRHPDVALYPGEANQLWHPRLYPWRYSPHRRQVPPIWIDPQGFASGSARFRDDSDVQLLKATFGAYQMLRRRAVFLNESALTALLVPFIRAEFAGARIIHMVRDGRAVAPAWARRQHDQIERHRALYAECGFAMEFDDVLDRCASSWNQQVLQVEAERKVLRGDGQADLIEIRYESFCDAPGDSLAALAQCLDLDPAPLLKTGLAHIENRNAADKSRIASDAMSRIECIMAEGLRLHGYI